MDVLTEKGGLPFESLRRMVEQSSDMTETTRDRATDCRRYYCGDQLSDKVRAEYRKRKIPPIVNNRIQRKVDAMVGIEQNGRVDPRAYPRGPGDEQAADVATKALVFVDDQTRFDAKRSAAFEDLLVEGYGGVEVGVEQRRGKFEITVTRLRWEEIFYDPHSRDKDFADAMYLGVQKWMTLDQAKDLYSEAYEGDDLEALLQATLSGVGSSFDDRPATNFGWSDPKLKRVRVVQMYYKCRGIWYLCIFTGGGEIFHGESPYQNEYGETECPLILMTGYIGPDNRRFGVVDGLIDLQDEINARRSRVLQMAFARQTAGLKGAVSVTKLKAEMSKVDGHVEIDPEVAEAGAALGMNKAFEVLPQMDQAAAQFQLLQESKEEIDRLGPNASLLGQLTGDQSGRAIMAQQQAGMAELAPIYDSLRDWTLRCYRAMWARIRQYWTEERWVRVTEDTEAPKFIGLNVAAGIGADMAPIVENSPAEMDVDIILDVAPDYATLRHEQFEQLTQMAERGFPIPPEAIIEASNLRDKQRILELIKGQQQAAAQAQQQAQAAAMQNEQIDTQSQAALRDAQRVKALADAGKTEFETRQAATATAIERALGLLPLPAAGA